MEQALDTFPRRLLHHAAVRPRHPATREKDLGIWQTWTWSRGRRRGARARLRARRAWASSAATTSRSSATTGRASTGRWSPRSASAACRCRCTRTRRPTSSSSCSTTPAIRLRDRRGPGAGRQAARGAAAGARRSRTSIYDDPRGMRNYAGAGYEASRATTRRSQRAASTTARIPDSSTPRSRSGRASDVVGDALHLGHDRQAQGRVPDATRAFIAAARRRLRASTSSPPTTACSRTCRWPGSATTCSRFAQSLVAGFTINCPESGDTVMTDLREIGPTYYFAPPRVFENLLTQVMIRMEDASAIKRWIFHHFMGVARRVRRRDPRRQAGVRASTASTTRSATCSSTGRCATCSA